MPQLGSWLRCCCRWRCSSGSRREGKIRIHRTPGVEHARACLPWLPAELGAVRPTLLGTLGATAAKALLGTSCRLTQHRGKVLRYAGLALVVAIHPSAVLCGLKDRQAEMLHELVTDVELVGRTVKLPAR